MLSLRFPGKIALRATFILALFCAQASLRAQHIPLDTPLPNDSPTLSVAQVNTIIAQAVGYLKSVNAPGIIAVADREGHLLAIYRMNTAVSLDPRINEQATVKARTASFFVSKNNAFTTRTAQFIVQSNFPPGIRNVDAGPLFGVPFSNSPGTDVQLQQPPAIAFVNTLNAAGFLSAPVGNSNTRPLGQPLVITPLTDDPGGIPIFLGKLPAGGVGIEIDGFGVLANGIPDAGGQRNNTGIVPGPSKQQVEEAACLAAISGFEPPALVRANKIVINGFRFPYVTAKKPKSTAVPVASLAAEGKFEPFFDTDGTERSPTGTPLAGNPYAMTFNPFAVTITPAMQPRATPTQEIPLRGWVPRFPPRASPLGTITVADVKMMVQQAADQAFLTRAAIRNPKDKPAAVWISVVDTNGDILGVYRTEDATYFSFDLAVQKARTAAFFSTDNVGFSSRAIGFMSQTFYPPGVSSHPPGPMSGLLEQAGGNAGALGANPTGTNADNLTQISQLLTDDETNTLVPIVTSAPPGPSAANSGFVARKAMELLARRLPHIRDGRISPLQVCIFVDLSLRNNYLPALPPATTLRDGICIFPGGVPIYKNGILVGGLGISGDGVDQDDVIAFNGQRGFLPPDGVRCDQASPEAVKAALLSKIPLLKTQFPTLTNGLVPGDATSPAVIDVLENRLNQGPILEGLRLPYIKIPRSSNR